MRAYVLLAAALGCSMPSGFGEVLDINLRQGWVADCGVSQGRYAFDSVLVQGGEHCADGRSWAWEAGPQGAQLLAPQRMMQCPLRAALGECRLELAVFCEHDESVFAVNFETRTGSVELHTEDGVCRYESVLSEVDLD